MNPQRHHPHPLDPLGPIAMIVWAVMWDVKSPGRTISRFGWDLLDRPILGPVYVGALAGLGWHLIHKPKGH